MASSPPVAAQVVAKYSRGQVRIRWQQVASADGYTIYLDGQAVSVAATASSYDFKTSAPGTHFVQVVTRRGDDVSFPATAHVDVPYPQPAPAASAIPATPTAGPVTEAAPPTQTALAPPAQAVAQPTPAPATHVITGSVSGRGYAGAVNGIVTGDPDTADYDMTGEQLQQAQQILASLESGATYACPLGAGGGFSDLVPGAQVVIADASGTVIATGELQGGVLSIHGCTFTFRIAKIPTESYYEITVTQRGALDYSYSEMQKDGWHVTSTIG